MVCTNFALYVHPRSNIPKKGTQKPNQRTTTLSQFRYIVLVPYSTNDAVIFSRYVNIILKYLKNTSPQLTSNNVYAIEVCQAYAIPELCCTRTI